MNGRPSSNTGLQHWLRAELVDYAQRDLVFSHVDTLLAVYTLLKPKRELFIYDDGRAQHLLSLAGLLPITYRNASYNIPVSIWLPFDYPKEAPMVYVVPTKDMVVKASRDLDPSGKWTGEYLKTWGRKPETSSLKMLCESLQDVFSHEPPLYRKAREELGRPESTPAAQTPPRPASQGPPERPPMPPPRPPPPGVREGREQSPAYSPSSDRQDPRARPPPPLPGQTGGPPASKMQSPPHPSSIASSPVPPQPPTYPYHPHARSSLPPYGFSSVPYSPQPQGSQSLHPPQARYSGPPPTNSPSHGPTPPFPSQPGSPTRPPPVAHQQAQPTPVPYPTSQPSQLRPTSLPSQHSYAFQLPAAAPYPDQTPVLYPAQTQQPPPLPPQPSVHGQATGWKQPQTPVEHASLPTPARPASSWQAPPAAGGGPTPGPAPSPYPQQQQHSYQRAPPQAPLHPSVYPSLPDGPQRRSRPSIPQPDFLSSDPEPLPPRSSSPPPPLPPNPHILSLHMALLGHIQQRLSQQIATTAAEIDRMRTIQNELAAGPARIQDEMARLAAVRDVCHGVVNRLEGVVKEAEGRLSEVKTRGEVPVDEIVCADSIVGNQLISLVAEDNAIEDTLYHLHRALNSGRIDLERFIKTTRALAEEQFMKRALVEKILNGLPMGLWSPH